MIAEVVNQYFTDIGIGVYRAQHTHTGKFFADLQHRLAYLDQRLSKIFAPMRRQQDVLLISASRDGRQLRFREAQGVDDGVTRHMHRRCIDTLGQQVVTRVRGRTKIQLRQTCHCGAVEFFRKRVADVEGSKAGLDMREGNIQVEAGQGRAQHRGGVALRNDQRRALFLEGPLKLRHQAAGQLGQRLAVGHHFQISIHRQFKPVDQGHQQFPVLARTQKMDVQRLHRLQGPDHGGHFDDLGSGACDADNFWFQGRKFPALIKLA